MFVGVLSKKDAEDQGYKRFSGTYRIPHEQNLLDAMIESLRVANADFCKVEVQNKHFQCKEQYEIWRRPRDKKNS